MWSSDIASDNDETVREPDRRLHVRFCPGMLLAPVNEAGVGRQPEWLLFKAEMLEIGHVVNL
jgi:hypothetical protein